MSTINGYDLGDGGGEKSFMDKCALKRHKKGDKKDRHHIFRAKHSYLDNDHIIFFSNYIVPVHIFSLNFG